jgi:hypothetical protein
MKFSIVPVAATLAALACLNGPAFGQDHHERVPAGAHASNLQLDQRYHHDHCYPPRGYVTSGLPGGSISIAFGGGNY